MGESTFGKRLAVIMQKKDISRATLKDATGISLQSISNYLKDKRKPDCEMVAEIAKALNISADYLLGLSEVSTRNETIQGINKETGLWENAIAILKTEKVCGDNNMSDFVSYLVMNTNFQKLISAIKQKNNYSGSAVCSLDVDGKDQEILMGHLWKVIVTDLFWEIVEGYTAKPGEIMVGYKVGENNG
ncbi:MAG: helix-turn-helix domain-containing protein [Oscillospiraceae bacterium]|nr:helix-turn-helix domain-containing protein [Oscillospiraceae bacterium]